MELQNSGAAPCGVATGVPDEGASETIVAVAVEGAGYLHVGKQIEWDSPAYREIGRMSHKTPSVDGQAPNHIQFMRSADQRPDRALFKAYRVDGERYIKSPLQLPYVVETFAREANDICSAMDAIYDVACDRESCMVLGRLRLEDERVAKIVREGGGIRRLKKERRGQFPFFTERARHFFMIDFDPNEAILRYCERAGLDVYHNADHAVRVCVREFLPREFAKTSFGYALSAGAGIDKNGNRNGSVVKFHIFFWLETPVMPEVVKAWMGAQNRLNAACGYGKLHKNGQIAAGLDLALYQAVQPHFISVRFEGGDDPLSPQRWGFVPGDSDSFLLETETDTKVEELEFKDGDKTVTKKITSSEHYVVSGRGKDRRRISRRGERVAWPYNWRDRLALIPEHGFHATLLATTYALARELVRCHGQAIFADTVTPYFAEIDAAIDAAPRGGRSLGDIEERKDDVSRICSGMRLRSYELRKPNGLASAVKRSHQCILTGA